MNHQLETENEELRKQIESIYYEEIPKVDLAISNYAIMDMAMGVAETKASIDSLNSIFINQIIPNSKWRGK
jgi:hypothetical protein